MKLHSIYQTSLTLLVSSGVGLAICQPSNAATDYSVLDLGNLGLQSKSIFVTGLNNSGQVAGGVYIPDGIYETHGFRTKPNSPINPATDYIDPKNVDNNFTSTGAINDLGQVIGIVSYNDTSGEVNEGFRTAPNSPINLITDSLGNNFNVQFPGGINNLGQVIISAYYGHGIELSYRTTPNNAPVHERYNIGTLGGVDSSNHFDAPYSVALDINDLGQVVGASLNTDLEIHAFRTAPNSSINPATDDLGTLGGSESRGNAINNLGQVVGESTTSDGETHAFLTAPNSPINPATDDLGTLGGLFSSANDVNNLGQVVGESTIANGDRHAFLYDEGEMLDLNDLISPSLGVTLNYVGGINDRGQIIAQSEFFVPDGNFFQTRAFLLTPIVSIAVPEPSFGLSLLAFAAVGGSFIIKKKA